MNEPRVAIFIERRGDGGLRIYSEDVPGLILSSKNLDGLGMDIIIALRVLRPDLFEDVPA